MGFAHALQGTEQHPHRERAQPLVPGNLAQSGRWASCHPVSLQVCAGCSGCFSALSLVGKEGPWDAEVARAMMAALRPGQPPGRAPVSGLEGQFPRTMLYCSRGSFLHPLSPSSDLTFCWLLFPLHLLNLYSGVLSSLLPMCSSALPLPAHESCCLPHAPLPCRGHRLTAA